MFWYNRFSYNSKEIGVCYGKNETNCRIGCGNYHGSLRTAHINICIAEIRDCMESQCLLYGHHSGYDLCDDVAGKVVEKSKRVREHLNGEPFFLTYGDGVSDVNIEKLLKFHKKGGRMATLTTVQPMGRFGALDLLEDGEITNFKEKKKEDSGWINAGFMVLEPEIIDLIQGDDTVFEKYPLEEAARRGQLDAYRHNGFWQCMDTLNEKKKLEEMWQSGNAPWRVWDR